jgi:hypothetical protein
LPAPIQQSCFEREIFAKGSTILEEENPFLYFISSGKVKVLYDSWKLPPGILVAPQKQ